jgi:serine/threonine-protein kinase RsbW
VLISKTIESTIAAIPQVIAQLLKELEQLIALSPEDHGSLRLILDEAITNAVRHGNRLDKNRKVIITLEARGDVISIRVKDEGPGFDYHNISYNITAANEELKSSGRGLFFIFKTADQITFNESGSEIRITKRIHR